MARFVILLPPISRLPDVCVRVPAVGTVSSTSLDMDRLRKFNMICAADESLGIGKNQALPWNLPTEYGYFHHQATLRSDESKQNAAIMGRKTWVMEPHRINPLLCYIVVSQTLSETPPGAAYLCRSVADAVKLVSSPALSDKIDKVWLFGGYGIYKEGMTLPQCHRIYLTRVYAKFECDAFFPELDTKNYKFVSDPSVNGEIQEENGIQFKCEIYEHCSDDNI